MSEKTVRDIHDRLMSMEGGDVAFDVRQECLDLCEIVSELQAKVARQEMEIARLQQQIESIRDGRTWRDER
ncbi:MAG: hypothetical protein WC107_06165 [Patescibacteria group bacterium]